MGIKHFFMWFKNHFSEYMHKLRKHQTFASIDIDIDNLMIDMNGIFHNSAQRIYEYGNYKPQPRLMKNKFQKRRSHVLRGSKLQIKVFEDVCKTIENLFKITN